MEINIEEFDEIAREVFAPVYPVIAKQIKYKTGITTGTCLDIGTGGGYLGIELAKITDLSVILFDKSEEMLKIAGDNIIKNALEAKVRTQLGDVHNIPFKDQTINLVISRGSIFFWQDLQKAFKEIHRILTPEGMAYIGGGFGTAKLKEQIIANMKRMNKEWKGGMIQSFGNDPVGMLNDQLRLAGIKNYEVIMDESGLWLIMRGGNNIEM
ncbi:class I SAM-dependent methyltransferase [Thermoanaerobacterium sp. RBIITD]|uniref:class I SAM-dependent methyltransferase n=1 Tax=Thermoanaerobacterium sp. RBIITD TaxID=1550240 RepID=UPI000BB6D4D7|nr:class I SAM-dependent methyltransferase [Thermoanaerobacterium sp. RBIITD]SNX54953.1 Methyltransferase domain-containing protein [Thermoanaerobacterium sp. RBIITD]